MLHNKKRQLRRSRETDSDHAGALASPTGLTPLSGLLSLSAFSYRSSAYS